MNALCGLRVLAAAATAALAQSPGEGLSKVSVATGADPLAAMAFMQRYFGTTPTDDSCQSNVCPCAASDVVQGFSQLARADSLPGTCVLLTEEPGGKTQADRDTVSVFPGRHPGKDCVFEEASMLTADGNASYQVSAHSPEQCCKSCEALAGCKAATFTPPQSGVRRLEARGFEGFGVHFPGLAPHSGEAEDEFAAGVRELEEVMAKKAGSMEDFDAFMDYNVGLWTSNMDGYIKKLDEGGVPYFAAKWPAPKESEEMYSLFVHVPSTQMFVELMSFFSVTHASRHTELLSLEQRLSDVTIEAMKEHPPQGDTLQPVKVSRAATDIAALDNFYVEGMRAEKVFSQTRGKGTYKISTHCYQWPEGKADVCFVQRPDSATAGEFKVSDYEKVLKSSAETGLLNPHCRAFRWEDNHYAVDLVGDFEHIVRHVESDESIKFQCRDGRLRYVYDPTGWAVKLNMLFSRCPFSCPNSTASEPAGPRTSRSRRLDEAQPSGYDSRCDPGQCDAVKLTVPKCLHDIQDASLLGPNCTQCEQLVKSTCAGGVHYCHKCASAHKPEWHSVGCAAAGCEESLEQLCADAATDSFTGDVQMKFQRPAAGPAAAAPTLLGRGAAQGCAAAAGAVALAALLVVGGRRVRARGSGGWTQMLWGGVD